MTYRKRALTALVAGALALPFLATPASAAERTAGPAQPIADFCTNPFAENFVDVNATDVFALAIQCISTAGREIGQPITVGGPEGRPANEYGPNRGVLRGQMASFIARMLDAAEQRDRQQNGGTSQIQALPGYDGSNSFQDVANNNVHVANINRLADAGVVLGGPGGRPANIYAPNEFISRAQMASFINRAAAYAMSQNPNGSGTSTGYTTQDNFFVDSGEIAVHQANINGLAAAGIVIGVEPVSSRRYAPRATVTRAQMAGFISRTLSQLFDDNRIHSLLETLSGNLEPADRSPQTFVTGTRQTIDFAGLKAGEQYRVTLVDCDNVNRDQNDLVTFTNSGGLATAGTVNTRIVGFGFGQSGNDAPAGTTNSAAVTPPGTTLSVTIENDGTPECVVAVIYLNGGAGQALESGGSNERLDVDSNGRPIEFFGISGDITFVDAGTPEPGTIIEDARVATDAAMATDNAVATNTASEGDVFTLQFDASVATNGAVTVTVEDATGDNEFTIECVDAVADAEATNTAAACTLSEDGRTLTIELLEDPVLDGTGDGTAEFPLTITAIEGLEDEDGNPIDLRTSTGSDTEIERDGDTVDIDDPSPSA